VSFSTTNTSVVTLDGTNGTNVTIQGIGTASIVATAAGNANYLPATLTTNLLITAIPSSFSFAASSETNVYNGSNQTVLLATNPNNIPVNYTYSNTATHIVSANPPTNAGSYTVVASVSDTTNYTPLSVTNTLVIAKATAPLTFTGPTNFPYTGLTIQLNLSNPAGAPVRITNVPSTPITIGTYRETASISDTNNYYPASCTNWFTIVRGSNAITFPHLYSRMLGSPYFLLDSNNATWGAVSYSSASTNISITGSNRVIIRGIGTATIVASQVGTSSNYFPALPVTNTLLITPPIPSNLSTYLVSTYAGNGTSGSLDATGTNATFLQPYGAAIDAAGNLYVADKGNNLIRRISPYTTNVTTIAGDGNAGFTDGMGTNAEFNNPSSVAVDASGNLYVADAGNNAIRRIDAVTTKVTTLAGSGASGFSNGVGTNASFGLPFGICVDGNTNIYVADTGNHLIRRIDARTTNVTTYAGNGTRGYSNAVGIRASFNQPFGICVDAAGNLEIADAGNNAIRRIDARTNVTTLAGSTNGTPGFADGMGTAATFHAPSGVAADWQGNLYVSDTGNNAIRKILTNGVVKTIAGNTTNSQFFNLAGGFSNGLGTNAAFSIPCSLTVDGLGNVYVADSLNNAIRILSPTNAITFDPLTNQVYGNPPFGLFATASMGTNPVTFRTTNSNIITLSGTNGTNLTILGAGTATIIASQAYNPLYPQAVPVTNSLIIAQAPVSVNLSNTNTTYNGSAQGVRVTTVPPSLSNAVAVTYSNSSYGPTLTPPTDAGTYSVMATLTTPSYTGSSNCTLTIAPISTPAFAFVNSNPVVTYTGSNAMVGLTNVNGTPIRVTYNGSTSPPVGAGTYMVVATVTDTNNYTFRSVTNTLVINQGGNVITFAPLTNQLTYSTNPGVVALQATASSGLPVSYSSLNTNISISFSNQVTILGAGTATIVASQAGDGNYLPAISVTNALVVAPAVVSVSLSNTNTTYNGSAQGVAVTVSPSFLSNKVSITYSNATYGPTSNPPTNAGTYPVVVSVIDPNYAGGATSTLTIARCTTPAFNFVGGSLSVVYNGSNLPVGFTNNTNGTPITVTYNGLTSPPVDAGTYTVVAIVTDTNNYTFRSVTNTLVIAKAPNVINPPVFAVSPLSYTTSSISVGLVLGASASSGLPVTYSNLSPSLLTLSSTNITLLGVGTATIVASQSGDSNYLAALPLTNPIVINKQSNVITFFPLSNLVYNTNGLSNTYGLHAYASSGLPVSFSTTNANLISISGTNVTLLGVGSGSIVASQTGNGAYAAATPVTNPFTISPPAVNYLVTTYAGQTNWGYTNAQGTNAAFFSPRGVALDRFGNLYVADADNYVIRKIDTKGNVTTVAGNDLAQGASKNGPGTNATFDYPMDVAIDRLGNVYVADSSMIRKIDTNSNVTTLAGNFYGASGLAVDGSGNVYVADSNNNMIRKIDTNGNVTTLAGNNKFIAYGYVDGIGTNATFNYPADVAVDGLGNVYVADLCNQAIRKIDTNNVVTTIIANSPVLNGPMGLALDGSGNLFVAESSGNAIREISATGVLTTLAGGSYGSNMQNGYGTNATFNYPTKIDVDSSGRIYVGDTYNNTIRLMTPQ
jgi:streptogramin lyase